MGDLKETAETNSITCNVIQVTLQNRKMNCHEYKKNYCETRDGCMNTS